MRSGPTKKSTRDLIVDLDKQAKKAKKRVWKVLSDKLNAASRSRAEMNVYTLERIAKNKKERIFVLAGKLLSKGEINSKVEIACLSCSKKAKEKIENAGGSVISLKELIEKNPDANRLVIVQ
ncbi:MAG TPA: 50S ribosomal protein L18e [archaeon]|nr:50S ribosomal protein L18e [archaeon]